MTGGIRRLPDGAVEMDVEAVPSGVPTSAEHEYADHVLQFIRQYSARSRDVHSKPFATMDEIANAVDAHAASGAEDPIIELPALVPQSPVTHAIEFGVRITERPDGQLHVATAGTAQGLPGGAVKQCADHLFGFIRAYNAQRVAGALTR